MTREEFIAENPIEAVMARYGIVLNGEGRRQRAIKCPFHKDGNPSFSVDIEKGLWHCHAGCGGGSVIDLIAKFDGKDPKDVLRALPRYDKRPTFAPRKPASEPEQPKATIEKVYQYQDALGGDVYQVVRMVPKTFRQRHIVDGKWVWNMDGVDRVLYRLPDVLKAQSVWIVEGEKDADNLNALGLVATCNVGGAGKWLDGYTESLAGKSIVICGDNDTAGATHVEKVFESIAGKVAEVRLVKVPAAYKDVSDWLATHDSPETSKRLLAQLRDDCTPFYKGIKLPVFHISDIEGQYARHVLRLNETGLDLGKWLPTLGRETRKLVPGELVMILGATGVGKTAILSNIAMAASNFPTLFFELELPPELLFERIVALRMNMKASLVEQAYATGDVLGQEQLRKAFPSLYICTEARLTVEAIEAMIGRAELKMGERPKLVLLDYVGLIQSKGTSKYDRVSQTAEDLKVMAKATQTIVVCASQISRKGSDESTEVNLQDGKDSGSIENSAGLVLGAWRDDEDKAIMHIKILKNTKGQSGTIVHCNYDGAKLKITEQVRTMANYDTN